MSAGPDVWSCEGETVSLNAMNSDAQSIIWSTSDTSINIVVSNTGPYWILASNQCGTAFDSINIMSKDALSEIFIPNVFTPEGDGRNEKFDIIPQGELKEFNITIFNRWGRLVFRSKKH